MDNEPIKVIFLDIDGVLNHQLFYEKRIPEAKKELRKQVKNEEIDRQEYHRRQIDSSSVVFLNDIIEATGAKVVLSSSWRLGNSKEYMQTLLADCGFTGELIDRTPRLEGSMQRGPEIEAWLAESGIAVSAYVILDDDSDMTDYQLKHHYIHVDRYCGLSPTVSYKATRILNGEATGQFRGLLSK